MIGGNDLARLTDDVKKVLQNAGMWVLATADKMVYPMLFPLTLWKF